MTDNILQFGDAFWCQLRGTAMGTSTAVNHANLYVGSLEVTILLKKFSKELLFHRRFIDDGVGVWLSKDPSAWSSFLKCLNSWGSLRWTSDGLTDEIVFMDLTIQIDTLSGNRLIFETFQKSMNLCLHMPPNSAHPEGLLRGLMFGRLRACWHQNANKRNFVKMAQLLANRLFARGCSKKLLTPLFIEATERLSRLESELAEHGDATSGSSATRKEDKPIFFHSPYHPRGMKRPAIRKHFNATLQKL
jgi:hypothetical protein